MREQISHSEMQSRAVAFAAEWADETRERAEAQSFWNDFFAVFGYKRRDVAIYEQAARRLTGERGSMDVYWPGVLAAEHKSAGMSLDGAHNQAMDYLADQELERPRLVAVCDFATMRVTDLDTSGVAQFPLTDLPRHVATTFRPFIDGGDAQFVTEEAITARAAEKMGSLYEALSAAGYPDHDLAVVLVRLMFLMFADDTQVWRAGLFTEAVESRTAEDLGGFLVSLFQTLNTPHDDRPAPSPFEYVNGGLFEETVRVPYFTQAMREVLLDCCHHDWSDVSPVIFGSIFQSVMDPTARRELGAHYTAEKNILRVIEPLFLDDLWAQLDSAGHSAQALRNLQSRIAGLRFLDPACGCGNFLMVTYRELRRIELQILHRLRDTGEGGVQLVTRVDELAKVTPSQFYGIELVEFPARIAHAGMYLVDHLANLELSAEFGQHLARFPMTDEATITIGNALRIEWEDTLSAQDCTHLYGNPPFAGRGTRTEQQNDDLKQVWGDEYSINLDYVTGWYVKALDYLKDRPTRAAFVSTNSISQGAQVASLWQRLLGAGVRVDFAHQSFVWQSDLSSTAAVHVVVVGFSDSNSGPARTRRLFSYPEGPKSAYVESNPPRINPYLVNGPDVMVETRGQPLSEDLTPVSFGSMARDGGHLFIETPEELAEASRDPIAARYIRRAIGARQLIHGEERWCLWLAESELSDLRESAILRDRVSKVKDFREASRAESTRKFAQTPWLFAQLAQPDSPYIAIPRHVSEDREWFTVVGYGPDVIATDALFTANDPDGFIFGILSSTMFHTWLSRIGGRLKGDLRFAKRLVYNTFPLPAVGDKDRKAVRASAAAVVEARSTYSDASLSDLYDPLITPPNLRQAHKSLDKAVDTIFRPRKKKYTDVDDRLAHLLDLYRKATAQ